jgi:glycosyltransferase involved in cell wall biosynthesis
LKFDKIYLLYPDNNGGVKEVCKSLEVGFAEHAIAVESVTSFKKAFKEVFKSRWSKNKYLFITNLDYGCMGLFAKHSLFIIHGYPYFRNLGVIQYYTKAFFHYLFSRFNTKTVAVSFLTRYICENHLGITIDKVILNPLPVNYKQIKVSKNKNSIVYIGRIVESKGLKVVLEAIKLLRNEVEYSIQFNIIGEGPLLTEYKLNYAHSDNVFYGYVEDEVKYEILDRTSVFVSLGEGEPFGITALEASCSGLRCVLPLYGGHAEFVDQSLLFSVKDVFNVEEVKNKISKAFFDCNTLHDKKTSIEDFKPDKIAAEYLKLF